MAEPIPSDPEGLPEKRPVQRIVFEDADFYAMKERAEKEAHMAQEKLRQWVEKNPELAMKKAGMTPEQIKAAKEAVLLQPEMTYGDMIAAFKKGAATPEAMQAAADAFVEKGERKIDLEAGKAVTRTDTGRLIEKAAKGVEGADVFGFMLEQAGLTPEQVALARAARERDPDLSPTAVKNALKKQPRMTLPEMNWNLALLEKNVKAPPMDEVQKAALKEVWQTFPDLYLTPREVAAMLQEKPDMNRAEMLATAQVMNTQKEMELPAMPVGDAVMMALDTLEKKPEAIQREHLVAEQE